jgi:hypothetical protein
LYFRRNPGKDFIIFYQITYNSRRSEISKFQMSYHPIRFINEPIIPYFNSPPLFEKKPGCPDSFVWRNEEYLILDILNEWHDYRRLGRMARNMSPEHAASAEKHGSWGVGQDYYRILTGNRRIFEIYYDRAPKDATRRKGEWFIYRELELKDGIKHTHQSPIN